MEIEEMNENNDTELKESANCDNISEVGGVLNVSKIACSNPYFRKEMITGEYMQMTVMSIPSGGEVGLEIHNSLDQLLKVERGVGQVYMGKTKKEVKFVGCANADCVIFIPANTWHNVLNEQNCPLKMFSIYAPPHHPVGTIHKTKFDSDLADY